MLYAELDELEAQIAELEASLDPTPAAQQHAEQARKQADESQEAAHGEASQAKDYQPSETLSASFARSRSASIPTSQKMTSTASAAPA